MLFSAAFKIGKRKITFTFHSIKNLEMFCEKVRAEYPHLLFYLFNRSRPTPSPDGFRPKPPVFWCPYCAAPRKFVRSSFNPKKYNVCEICEITDSNYYVRKENNLWEMIIFTEDGEVQVRKGGKTRKISKKNLAKAKKRGGS